MLSKVFYIENVTESFLYRKCYRKFDNNVFYIEYVVIESFLCGKRCYGKFSI